MAAADLLLLLVLAADAVASTRAVAVSSGRSADDASFGRALESSSSEPRTRGVHSGAARTHDDGVVRRLLDDDADALLDADIARWRQARRRLRQQQQQQQHAVQNDAAWRLWQEQQQQQQEDDGGGDGPADPAASATTKAAAAAGSEAVAGAAVGGSSTGVGGGAGGGGGGTSSAGSSGTHALVAALHRLLAAAKAARAKSPESHVLKLRQLQRAMYLGDLERIRSFVWRMAAGERLTVALLGGSVTMGMGAVLEEPSYAQWLQRWFAEVAPARAGSGLPPEGPGTGHESGRAGTWLGVVGPGWNASTVRVINAACPATSSGYMNLCLGEYLLLPAHSPDLVLLEYAINDPPFPYPAFENEPRKSLELLLRKLLLLPGRPAVVFLNGYRWHGHFTLPGPAKREALGVYYSNTEPEYFEFATYYGLQLLSLKAAVFHQMVAGVRGFRADVTRSQTRTNATADHMALFYEDPMHPSAYTGHRAIAELVIGLLVKVGRGLVMRPWRQSEEAARVAPLPRHLIPGNEDSVSDVCILGNRLRESAVDPKGFSWINEGRDPRAPKWGFTATQPGASIAFLIDTTSGSSSSSGGGVAATAGVAVGSAAGAANGANADATAAGAGLAAAATATAAQSKPRFVMLILAYLRSYESMGLADITCAGGCVCGDRALDLHRKYNNESAAAAMAPAVAAEYAAAVAAAAANVTAQMAPAAQVDGLWEARSSQLQLGCVPAVLLTAQPLAPAGGAAAAGGAAGFEPCRVVVQVAQDTRSSGHKVWWGGDYW
ncbi:hypothetical protein HYH02_001215 [Chlamydomonas schloesseri]|uniref:SGNH hydrolase-type esterase domain-containing protein n=1 Tax=Chlamydomonas schloesseri TaxID=2026947 RepID=A0A835WUY0_9CHLO|nr:hypothetical protein HYH02_001215 [Chlamydomonas schloesseri]|eukprot:KAG2454180.1 hypothetical protein HYH02_001215 [Chlamydomonas schloesseri]